MNTSTPSSTVKPESAPDAKAVSADAIGPDAPSIAIKEPIVAAPILAAKVDNNSTSQR